MPFKELCSSAAPSLRGGTRNIDRDQDRDQDWDKKYIRTVTGTSFGLGLVLVPGLEPGPGPIMEQGLVIRKNITIALTIFF